MTRSSTSDVLNLLQRLADSPDTIVWMSDRFGNCIYLTQANNAYGAVPAPFDMATWVHQVHPADHAQFGSLVASAREARRAYKVKYRLIRSDGTERGVLGVSEPRFDVNNEFEGYVGFILDISDWNFIFSSSPIATAHRLVTENCSDLITHHAPRTGNYLYVSASIKQTLGYEPSEMLGACVYDFVHPDDISVVRTEIARQAGGLPSSVIEHRFRTKEGEYLWLSTNFTLLKDVETGAELGAIAVARNITAERKSREALRRSEERLRSLMKLSLDWYWETDVDGRFTFVSEGLHRLLGTSPAALLGKTRRERAADLEQQGLIDYEAKIAAREPFRDLVYSTYTAVPGVLRHSAISGEPVFEDGEFVGYRGVGRDITRDVEMSKELEQQARHDVLTGLPNRVHLQQRLAEMLSCQRNEPFAVLFIDLDRFKEVNDTLGHAAGDQLLKVVAGRLRANVKHDDLIARFGGDEFVVCARASSRQVAAKIAKRLLFALSEPIVLGTQAVPVQASIGVSLFPEDGDTIERLFHHADLAMYEAKSSGRSCFQMFVPALAER